MTAQEIINKVTADINADPDMSNMSFIEMVFCIGVCRVYRMHARGSISLETGRKLKARLLSEFELWKLYEDIFQNQVKATKKAEKAGVQLTKLLNEKVDTEILLSKALEVLNLCGLNGGIPWERGRT